MLEAMAHGRPVVATSWSGYRDLVVDGETGFLLKTKWPEDSAKFLSAYSTLLTPPELADYLAQRTVIDIDELVHRLQFLASNPVAAVEMGLRARSRASEHYSWPHIAQQYLNLWTDQIDHAQHLVARERPSIEYGRIFGHYADEPLSRHDVLVAARGPWTERNITNFWPFRDGRQVAEIRNLLLLCRTAPASIGDLLDRGFTSDCILWLAKKGVCRIVSPRSAAQPVPAARATTTGAD